MVNFTEFLAQGYVSVQGTLTPFGVSTGNKSNEYFNLD
jgi:hypothetical protein